MDGMMTAGRLAGRSSSAAAQREDSYIIIRGAWSSEDKDRIVKASFN